jgi:serine/threonine-protein kinase SRPK3
MSEDIQPFDESSTSVRINDIDDGEEFLCDEEPHMLTPEQGYGYYPITLGTLLHDGKLEIVRKLGWAGYSSVWLARSIG